VSESIKVTDKRMFTADGELREELSAQSEAAGTDDDRTVPESKTESARAQGEAEPAPTSSAREPLVESAADSGPSSSGGPRRATAGALRSPTFVDLVGLLAQPIAMFLGDVAMPGGEPQEDLPLARFHIDLLELVQTKTQGNISSEEAKLLEDLLYQLRMRYIEKVG